MSENVVAVDLVLDDIVLHVVPLSDDLSIAYPVIGEPPLSVGADHERFTCVEEATVAVNPVGNWGTVFYTAVIWVLDDIDITLFAETEPVSSQWSNSYLP